MDEADSRILALLSKNSRQSNATIAARLGVSEGTVRSRIRRMVAQKKIRRFSIETDSAGFRAVILVKTNPARRTDNLLRSLAAMDSVRNIYEVSGKWDAVLVAHAKDAAEFNELIEAVRTKPGIMETESLVVLKTS